MKQKVQLFINNEEVDVFEDGSINIVSSIKDLRDPSKLFADYSRNFNLPATSRNNKVFKHYYNYDIVDGFDARKSVQAIIEVNNRPYKLGYINLEGVDLKNNKPSVYRVTFYGNLRFLKETFNEVKLSKLSWLDNFTFTYQANDSSGSDSVFHYLTSSKNITDEEGTTHIEPLVVPLITHTDRLYYNSNKTTFYGWFEDGNLYYDSSDYPLNGKRNGLQWDQLKPAIRIDLIIKAIEKLLSTETETVSFSTDFFNTSNLDYYNLYMWLHQKEGKIGSEEDEGVQEVYTPVNTFNIGNVESNVSGTNVIGMSASFTNSSGILAGPYADRVTVSIDNGRVESVLARLTAASTNTTTPYTLRVEKDGVEYETVFVEATKKTSSDFVEIELDSGTYTFIIITDSGSSFDFDLGFSLRLIARIDRESGDNVPDIVRTGTDLSLNNTGVFYSHLNMPDMTILEFLTGLFKMFNLVAQVRNDSPTQKNNNCKNS
jgi:hypothetical protein